MATIKDVIKKLVNDVKNLEVEIQLVKKILNNLIDSEIEAKNANQPGIDAWDPSCGPRPKSLGKNSVTSVSIPGGTKTNKRKK